MEHGSTLAKIDLLSVFGKIQDVSLIYAVFLLAIRISVVLAMTPILYAMPIPARIRAMLVVVLSLVLAFGLHSPSAAALPSAGAFIQAAFTELALGLTLALGVLLAFTAFSMAGNLLDIQIGFGIAQVFDPVSGRPAPMLLSAFNYVAVMVFFLIDGHHALIRGLAYSLEVFPVGASWEIDTAINTVLKQVTSLFGMGFALAAPVIFCIFLTEIALGVVARNLPQINMFALGIPIKIVVGLAVLSLWFTGIGGAMGRVYGSIYDMWGNIFLGVSTSRPTDSSVRQIVAPLALSGIR